MITLHCVDDVLRSRYAQGRQIRACNLISDEFRVLSRNKMAINGTDKYNRLVEMKRYGKKFIATNLHHDQESLIFSKR